MRYFSSRNKDIIVSPSEAIIQGISKDGGLFVPESFPIIDNLNDLINMDYKELAFYIMSKFLTDFSKDGLRECIDKAYDSKFKSKDIAPLKKVGDMYFLELYHGPTNAFKDMALSILPYLLKESMKIQGVNDEIVILTATSGDTGKAALEGFANIDNMKIVVFYPENGVSKIQKRQMITQEGENTFVVGINGNFDDAQSGVKDIFNDLNFINLLKENNYILSSANSINIGRLIPQIVYYYYSYLKLVELREIKLGEKINISVPTGNFGNILAAYYGKKMGLPVNKLICASNENNILTDFITGGIYDKRRDLILTTSPSMDILISSNLERLLYHLLDEDDELIKSLMEKLVGEGYYKIENSIMDEFYGGYSTNADIDNSINNVFNGFNYLIDTHTAVGYDVYEKYRIESKDDTKTIISSTASPYKFGKAVSKAIGLNIDNLDEFFIIKELSKASGTPIPDSIKKLENQEIHHKNNCSKEDMKKIIKKFLKVGEIDDRN